MIVSAPTGAGKTLIAEFAIFRALLAGQRLAYTTPLKALSNQKFADFSRQYGEERVGILTGDVKVNPAAPILVMTTEILRNMFYTRGLGGISYVVLDECHYMGDPGRGTVWEEIIVNAPKETQLVGLSATVANVREIADWIGLVHRPIVPIIHPVRPVPLQYLLCDRSGEFHTVGELVEDRVEIFGLEGLELGGETKQAWERRGRFAARRVAAPGVVVEELEGRGWLPAIYFIFSRAGCERAMDELLAEGRPLLEHRRLREVDEAIAETLREGPGIAESPLNQTIFQGLRMGAGLHHAGILPTLKRLTELLFERGLVKVVFATETMSLGIHMPAKSVVLQSLTKRTEDGFRSLTHNELTQMAGRAGRRGIDLEGKCVIALDSRDSLEGVLRTIQGPAEPIESQFHLGYGSVALLLETHPDLETIRRTVESSFGQYQNMKRIRSLESEVQKLEGELKEARGYQAPCGDFSRIGHYRALGQELVVQRQVQGREQRGRRESRDIEEVEPGRVVLLRRRGGGGLGAVIALHRLKGGRTLVDVLLPHGTVVRVKGSTVKRVFWSLPPLPLPRELRQVSLSGREHGWGKALRQILARDGTGFLARLRELSVQELLRGEGQGSLAERLEATECHRCPWGTRPQCEPAWKRLQLLAERTEQRQVVLDQLRNAYWQEFLNLVGILTEFDAVESGRLTRKGRLVAGLRHDNELLVAQVMEAGVLVGATAAEAAAILSCLVEEARSGEGLPPKLFLKSRPRLRRTVRELEQIAERLYDAQRARRAVPPVNLSVGFMPAVFRWASGDDDWAGIVEESFGGHEGDLIRAMRRLIDLLRQLSEAPEVSDEVAGCLRQAFRILDRGIVYESALI